MALLDREWRGVERGVWIDGLVAKRIERDGGVAREAAVEGVIDRGADGGGGEGAEAGADADVYYCAVCLGVIKILVRRAFTPG